MILEYFAVFLLIFDLFLLCVFFYSRLLFVMICLAFLLISSIISLAGEFLIVVANPSYVTPIWVVAGGLSNILSFLFVITTFRYLSKDSDASTAIKSRRAIRVSTDVDAYRIQHLKAIFHDLESASPTMDVVDQLMVAKMSQDTESANRLLTQLVLEDKCPEVRLIAIQHLTDQSMLLQIAGAPSTTGGLRKAAVERLHDQAALLQLASDTSINEELCKAALERLHDQASLAAFIRRSQNVKLCLQAVKQLSDPTLLQEISSEVTNTRIQHLATMKLKLLNATAEECFQIAKSEDDVNCSVIAIEMMIDQDHLFEIAKQGRLKVVRMAAIKRLQWKEDLETILKITTDSEICAATRKRLQELQ